MNICLTAPDRTVGCQKNEKMKQKQNKQIKKQNIMKKYMIVAAAAALCLASCAKVENYTVNTKEDAVIGFTTYSPKSISKASSANYAASTNLIHGAQFAVYGWSNPNETPFAGTGTQFMNWYTVTYQKDDANNKNGSTVGSDNLYPDGYRYWPSGDTPDKLSFYAYYPSNAASGTFTSVPTGFGAFGFTAATAAADMVDFMVADVVKDQVYETYNGTVPLTFRHMLTKVQFRFKHDSDLDNKTKITLLDAKLGNILKTGTLTTSYIANPGENETNVSAIWSGQSTTQAYEIFVNGVNIEENGSTQELTASAFPANEVPGDTFLMVPQNMVTPAYNDNVLSNSPQYLTIKWKVETFATSEKTGTALSSTVNTKTLYFDTDLKTTDGSTTPSALNLDWAKNNSIVYTITIGPKKILFTGSAAAWDTPETNGYFNVN